MSCGQVENSLIVYFSLTRTNYLVTGQVKMLMYLPEFLDFFTPKLININNSQYCLQRYVYLIYEIDENKYRSWSIINVIPHL